MDDYEIDAEELARAFSEIMQSSTDSQPKRTSHQKKNMVEEQADSFKSFLKNHKGYKGRDQFMSVGYTGGTLKRRKEAVCRFIEKNHDLLMEWDPYNSDVDREYSIYELLPVMGYGSLDDVNLFSNAAAIWFLDRIAFDRDKFLSLMEILPDDYEQTYSVVWEDQCFHPYYDSDLLRSVLWVMRYRNDNGLRQYDHVKIPNSSKNRRNFDRLMELVGREALDAAAQKYEAALMEFIKTHIKCLAVFDRSRSRIVKSSREDALALLGTNGLPFNINGSIPELASNARDLAVLNMRKNKVSFTWEENLIKSFDDIYAAYGNRKVAEMLASLPQYNPFEICAGFFWALDQDRDSAWLIRSACCVLDYYTRTIPWMCEMHEVRGCDENDDKVFEFRSLFENDWFKGKDAYVDKMDLYQKEKNEEYSVADLVYMITGALVPTSVHPFEVERERHYSLGVDKQKVDYAIQLSEWLYLPVFKRHNTKMESGMWKEAPVEETEQEPVQEENREDENAAQREELKRLKLEVKQLKHSLSEANKKAMEEHSDYEKEHVLLERTRRELADLRDLTFNREQGDLAEVVERQIEYPYHNKHRIVSYGGFDHFLKLMRRMLPDVRFVEADDNIDTQVIRHADIVFVQTNYLSHSAFNKINSAAKKFGVPMRYFAYSSAEKCAEQLIEIDEKE